MTDVDRAYLKSIVYGRDATPEERAAAVDALRVLDTALGGSTIDNVDEPEAVVVPAVEGNDAVSRESSSESGPESPGPAPSFWHRRIRLGWVVPLAIGAVLVGALCALGVTSAIRNSELAASTNPTSLGGQRFVMLDDVSHGDLRAADSWFDAAPTTFDVFPELSSIKNYVIDAKDVRLALNGRLKGTVWVARTTSQLCLLQSMVTERSIAATCVDRDKFESTGVRLTSNGVDVSWFGWGVKTRPQIATVAVVPPVPGSGPGNAQAARSWFSADAAPDMLVPDAFALESLRVKATDVRLAFSQNVPWVKLWVVTKGTSGFCLLVMYGQENSSANVCRSTRDFEVSGLTIAVPGFAVYWDGTVLSGAGA